jgi:hypothetical protein
MVLQWLEHCVTNWKVAGSIPDGVIEFLIDILPCALWPWGQYQEYFLGVKAAGA